MFISKSGKSYFKVRQNVISTWGSYFKVEQLLQNGVLNNNYLAKNKNNFRAIPLSRYMQFLCLCFTAETLKYVAEQCFYLTAVKVSVALRVNLKSFNLTKQVAWNTEWSTIKFSKKNAAVYLIIIKTDVIIMINDPRIPLLEFVLIRQKVFFPHRQSLRLKGNCDILSVL